MQTKMPHKPVKFPQLSEEKAMNNLEFTIFIVLSINERGSNSLKSIKSEAAFCCMLGIGWTTASLTSGVSVFAHVWEQMLDTLSNFCDDNIIALIQPYE